MLLSEALYLFPSVLFIFVKLFISLMKSSPNVCNHREMYVIISNCMEVSQNIHGILSKYIWNHLEMYGTISKCIWNHLEMYGIISKTMDSSCVPLMSIYFAYLQSFRLFLVNLIKRMPHQVA